MCVRSGQGCGSSGQIANTMKVHTYQYRGSLLSTNFGILKKSYYVKFVLVSTTQPISTSTVYSTQKFHQYGFQYIALKNRTSGNRTTGDRTSRGPPVINIIIQKEQIHYYSGCGVRRFLTRKRIAPIYLFSNTKQKLSLSSS